MCPLGKKTDTSLEPTPRQEPARTVNVDLSKAARTQTTRFADYYANRVEVVLTNNELLLTFCQILPVRGQLDKVEIQEQCRVVLSRNQAAALNKVLAGFNIGDEEKA